MKAFYDAGVQATCFISPIFPGITDPVEIIEAAKDRCNLVWLENLNLHGDCGARIKEWIYDNHPELDDLYHEIYNKKSRDYWTTLDQRMREYTSQEGMPYHTTPFDGNREVPLPDLSNGKVFPSKDRVKAFYDPKKMDEMLAYYADKGCEVLTLEECMIEKA